MYTTDIGLISPINSQFNFCQNSATNFVDECSKFYDFDALRAEIAKQCDGKPSCTLSQPNQYFYSSAISTAD
jgi:hypothetical protein